MTVLGPIKLNGGLVSDSDIWNENPSGGAFTYSGFFPWASGARTMDSLSAITTVTNNPNIIGMFYWQDPAQEGTSNRDIFIVGGNNAKMYTSPINSVSWTDKTGGLTLPTTGYYTFDVLNGKVLIGNCGGVSGLGPWKLTAYNNAIALLGGSPPSGGVVRVVNNFSFLTQKLDSTASLSRVYWSNVSDPETWGGANFIDVRLNDGDVVTGLSSISTDLIIYKTNSIWRLSTVTQTISGAVTLGPLTLITDRQGCAGPMSHDVMPDGTLVFFSPDGHLWQTDGASFVDLSHPPFPKSNIIVNINPYTVFPYASAVVPNFSPIYSSFVRVDPSTQRIFVLVKISGQNSFYMYCYDYAHKAWSDWSSMNVGNTNWVNCLAVMPTYNATVGSTAGFGASNKTMYFGAGGAAVGGYISSLTPWGPVKSIDGSTDVTCTMELSVGLGSNAPEFVPRSLMIPTRLTSSTTTGTMNVTIGFDGVYQSSPSYSSSIASKRCIVPISYTPGSPIQPLSMQVKIQLVGSSGLGSLIVEPFYISDERLT